MGQKSLSRKLFQGSAILAAGQVTSYALSFGRNIILARTLAKADFGLAAVFAMTITLLEVAGRMSFGQQIVQSKEGDSANFLATSHAFQFLLAFSGAVLIVCLSYPAAVAFKVPQAAWAFALLAVVPLARGFEHLDYYRQQRELNYLPTMLCEVVPQAAITIAAWPLARWLGDFRVIIWLMIGKAVLGILMTHALARQPYRWTWHQPYVKGMWAFGWPLLLTGLLVFASQQADQMVVGAFLSLNDLAGFALALSLVSIPWFIFGQVGSSLMLPILSRAQTDPDRFLSQYQICVELTAVAAVVLLLPLISLGEQIVVLFYGSKYEGTGIFMALLGAASAVRFLRFTPAVAAMARADTMNQLYSNLWRAVSLPVAVVIGVFGGSAILIATCALVAELVAATASLISLRRRQSVPLGVTVIPACYIVGFLASGLMLHRMGVHHWNNWTMVFGLLALLLSAIVIAFCLFRGFTQTIQGLVGRMALTPQPASRKL